MQTKTVFTLIATACLLLVGTLGMVPSAADPPAQSGPFVFRGESHGYVFFYWDDKTELMVTASGDPLDTFFCGGGGVTDPAPWQFIDNPSQAIRWFFQSHTDSALVKVWDIDADEFDCEYFASHLPVAFGEAKFAFKFTDWFQLSDGNHASILRMSATGMLDTPFGERVHLSSHSACVDNANHSRCSVKVQLHEGNPNN